MIELYQWDALIEFKILFEIKLLMLNELIIKSINVQTEW